MSPHAAISIRRRLVVSVLGVLSITYAIVIVNSEFVIRRDRLQRHQRLVMATAEAIDQQLTGAAASGITTPAEVDRVRQVLSDFSATRVLVWLSRPKGMQPIFPQTASTTALRDQRLLEAAGVNASGMQMPRAFLLDGETYFTCSMPLKSGQGVLRFLEDVGVSPASRKDNLINLFLIWAGLVGASALLLIPLARIAIRPLQQLENALDEVSLTPSGKVESVEVAVASQPKELQGIVAAYNRLAARLQQVWSQQHLLVNSMSHELVTPLALIKGSAKRLSRHSDAWPNADRLSLMAVVDEASRADRLVRDFLDIARDEVGRLVIDQQPFKPADVIRGLSQDIASLSWGQRVRIDDRMANADLLVEGDKERFRQCILNLLENASKYSPEPEPITVLTSSDADTFFLSVIDHGPGIREEERDQIFLPFYRSAKNTNDVKGTGIGLAIVKLLMKRMGGDVRVLDSSDPGTCFQLSLAVYQPALATVAASQ